jgi:imidazolonepropionase-like amidohydrolase
MKKSTVLVSLVLLVAKAYAQQTFPVNGTHDNRHNYYAFTHAHIYQDYATAIDDATLLIKDGKVVDIGTNISIPEGTVVYDCKGKNIYPSFIDLYTGYGMPAPKPPAPRPPTQLKSNVPGAYDWNQAVKPQTDAEDVFHANPVDAAQYRNLGFGVTLTSQHDGIVQGSYALVNFADTNDNISIIKGKAAAGLSFSRGTSTQDYPASLMGAIALLRQTYLDADWYKNAHYKTEFNISLEAFNNLLNLPQIFMVDDKLSIFRADKVAREFKANYIIKGAGDEYQRLDDIKATGREFIIPLNFPDKPKVQDPYDAALINYSTLLSWELAPLNPAALDKAGITFALTTDGLKDKNQFWVNLRKAIQYGLSPQAALKALTYTPAQMVGVQDLVGSLKKGMTANFIVTSGDIFKNGTAIYSNWINGNPYQVNDTANVDVRGKYNLNIDGDGNYNVTIAGNILAPAAMIMDSKNHPLPAYFKLSNPLVTFSFRHDGDTLHPIQLSGLLSADHKSMEGKGMMGSTPIIWKATLTATIPDSSGIEPWTQIPSMSEIRYPFVAHGKTREVMDSMAKVDELVLIKNATVWTGENDSALMNTDVELKNGQITAIGKNLNASGATVIDGTGKYLTSGIIDEHSHIAVSGDVNEGTEAISAEVRIGDVLNSEDISIYRSLSGGVVACQVLHGSANPIGGQSGIIKLRWGMLPEQLKISYAAPFIKFALGENVKQSNWGDAMVVRYPQSRMGVEQFYYDNFTRAKEYEKKWEDYNRLPQKEHQDVDAPRRDLRLETLAEILDGKRFITCHSYVQSEMNMLLHVADSFHFHFNTFTHGLEAYKIADKIAARHVGVSTFADWWAYKMEVMEAIPYNAAITTKMGIVTAINSDDDEMQRRLNQEAAKTVKYGGLTEQQAWRTVTLNPAKLLHLDQHMGSIKVGKDADVVLWSGNPLSVYSKVEKTFVDGICEYDAEANAKMEKELAVDRARLINLILKEPKAPGKK